MFDAVRVEGCSGYQARLTDNQHGGEEKEGSMFGVISEAIVFMLSKNEGRRRGQGGACR